jgi:superfamily II DNA or RNA helicase
VTGRNGLPPALRAWFGDDGRLSGASPEEAVEAARRIKEGGHPEIRVSQEVGAWLENRRRRAERKSLRREYELKVQSGEWPARETKVPLFPYQREGMLHLAFTERALLADEMGLGKTIQAIAACALLRRLGKARLVLVVTPASLKTEWEEQIERFTSLPARLVFGARLRRAAIYSQTAAETKGAGGPFFIVVNYEQALADIADINQVLRPEVVVLDEAQRIKNWATKTAQAIKRLKSRYAFVLTGTPIENRIDEIHSIMGFLDPSALGPLFRFNREYYQLDDRGRPEGYRNLGKLHERVRPYMLRRRKDDVETELPERSDRNHFVQMSQGQKETYAEHELQVSRLVQIAKRRPLTKQQQDKLMRELAMMRMICDTNYILDPSGRVCPKLDELEKILDSCRENDAKAIVFSEWERMLELVRNLCRKMGLGFAWHTGSVPQLRRRAEINSFKNDPKCRVFLSTDCGATGLNLQNASVVVNCDLPWNPAKLEQRIARAWRKNQTRPVTVVNLVSESTIEHRMLDTLANKKALADGVLDLRGDLNEIKLRGGGQAFLERLQRLMGSALAAEPRPPIAIDPRPVDPSAAFSRRALETINGAMIRCEERFPDKSSHSVLVVVVDGPIGVHVPRLQSIHQELFGPGKTDPLAPVRLEILDRATDEAIQRLIAAGLLAPTARASRPLFPAGTDQERPLTPDEIAKARGLRELAGRRLKMARILGEGGFDEEARQPFLEAIVGFSRACATERRLPEPADTEDALRPPLSCALGDGLTVLRDFAANESMSWRPAADALAKLLAD